MKGVVLVYMVVKVVSNVQCESESMSNDHSIVHGIAAKIGFPPTVLKVFIKGDIQAEEIEKLLNLYATGDKVPNDSNLARNRRNSITDYIGKLYSFNNVFRPYRSVFRGFQHVQTTKTPWLKKFLHGVHVEPKTEGFWGMALGAHTFSPFARPLAQTRIPHHRIRDQQRIDRLLGITRKDGGNVLAQHHETKPYLWIKNQEKFDKLLLVQAKNEETTTAISSVQYGTTGRAFHKAPFDVAGVTPTYFPHLHATRRRLKFCEKQCADGPEEARTKRPGSTGQPRPSNAGGQKSTADECACATTEKCTCTAVFGDDYLCDEAEPEKGCKCKDLNVAVSGLAKNVAQTKLTTFKSTTSKFTRSKERRPTGPVWTLPPNSILDRAKTTEERRRTLPETKEMPGDRTELTVTKEYTTATTSPQRSGESPPERIDEVTAECQSTFKHGKTDKQMFCIPMPIPTRIRIPLCPHARKTTKKCTRKTITPSGEDTCECQSRKSLSDEIPISVGGSLEPNRKTGEKNRGKPQKIIVRISSALGEVPVVIMRDNGVSGVSLSLVNDYLLDESNKLIKCLGQKPLNGRMNLNNLNSSSTLRAHSKGNKNRHFLPHLIRHQLHGLQPRRYSFNINYKPFNRLVSRPHASLIPNGNPIEIPDPALNHGEYPGSGILNQYPSYKLNSPDLPMGSFGAQYPAIHIPRSYQSFKMEPADPPIGPIGLPIPQMNLEGFPRNDISRTEYPRFQIHPGMAPGGMSLPRFESSGLGLPPSFPQQDADASQLMGYRPPFFPIFYPNKNDAQPPKYMIGGLQ